MRLRRIAVAVAMTVAISGCGEASKALTGMSSGAESGSPKKSHTEMTHMTASQANAVAAAKRYLATQAFSKKRLIQQLSSQDGEGYRVKDAVFAVNHLQVNWNEEAVKSALHYLVTQSLTRSGLLQLLESRAGEEFTHRQAEYAVKHAYN
jgi:host cell surface-exposed lipoprotein